MDNLWPADLARTARPKKRPRMYLPTPWLRPEALSNLTPFVALLEISGTLPICTSWWTAPFFISPAYCEPRITTFEVVELQRTDQRTTGSACINECNKRPRKLKIREQIANVYINQLNN